MNHQVITGIFVTYEMNLGILKNLKNFLEGFPHSTAVVVDNSSRSYKKKHRLDKQLKALSNQIIYVNHEQNCRLRAYSKGIAYCNDGYVVFRTDDDYFDERSLAVQLDVTGWPDLAVTPHFYDGLFENPESWERPLETMVFKAALLHSLCPMQHTPGGDWRFLKKAFESYTPHRMNDAVLHKRPHGRSVA
ncbi:glycosyltransferase [Salinimonas lutimaris]|uniref:glycosyltransferase n=1 Tax=Salinimonas lutimaris TaxID=914153 RepID=UPI0010C15674|nr:glycosyltransferase [Salinimonas lutimaris]